MIRLNILMLLMLTALPSYAFAETKDTRAHLVDPKSTTISGIKISSNEEEILRLLGKPSGVEVGFSEALTLPDKTLQFDGIEIYLINDEICNLTCTDNRCETGLGIGVGVSKKKVQEVYGPGNLPYAGAKRDTLSYPLEGLDAYLIFVFEDDVVTGIEYFVDYI